MNYFESLDLPTMMREYPIGDAFTERFRDMSGDELRALQEHRFARVIAFAWKVPFYRRLWRARGIESGDIRSLDDLPRLPCYTKTDLMQSVEAYPPLGNFHGLDAYPSDQRPSLIMQTTSGTTGRPQPLLFGPWSRELQNLLLARIYLMQGMRRDDVVHSVYAFGMVNGGHYIRETIVHWIGAPVLSAGTGVETRSVQQVQLMRDFRATVLVGFADYMLRLAEVARENNIEPGMDIRLRLISGLLGPGMADRLRDVWGGIEAYDWYGVGDTGLIAGESPSRCGMHVMEDAQWIELLYDTGGPAAAGEIGNIVCTCLYKHDVFPIIRFNTQDVTRELTGANPDRLPFRRIAGFLGRSDNMVKLRGINVYPTAIGGILKAAWPGFAGEYLCELTRSGAREDMTVLIEAPETTPAEIEATCKAALRARLGVELGVRLTAPGSLAAITGIETRQKPIRLVDRRG
jgi:phenylacetate-CoA ligase